MSQKRLDASDDTVRLTIRLTKGQTHQIDQHRGSLSRSAYLRSLIPEEEEQKPRIRVIRASDVKLERHLHRFKRVGEPLQYSHGEPIYQYVCVCGEKKVDR